MTLVIPSRYELKKLGPVGGQASIAHYQDKWLDRPVIMKAPLKPGAGYDVDFEVRSLAAVNSKHVVSLYDTIRNKAGNILAIVEEDVEGELLSDKFAQNLGTDVKLGLLYQLACGVSDMHQAGRVHRDLKPNNMKVRPDGLLKIFDFGISTILADGDETQVGKGTRGYKAPELFAPPPKKVSEKCDVYSVGVIAYRLFASGPLPPCFLATPPDPRANGVDFTSFAGLASRLASLLNACLSSDPADRPTATEIRDALAAELVRDKHRATIVASGTTYVLHATNRGVKVAADGNEITVQYTGTGFKANAVAGDVYSNNKKMNVGDELTGAMVITLGAPEKQASRTFVTFDVSHPEILV